MATDAKAFLVSLGFNAAVCFLVYVLFGLLRRTPLTHRFYSPKRYENTPEEQRPKRLPTWAWLPTVYRYTQEEVIRVAGMDGAMFLRIMTFGAELFFFVTLWCCIVVLPTNLSGNYVSSLIARGGSTEGSNFTWWIPPPPPPAPPGSPPRPSAPPHPQKAPHMYSRVPPAPAGLIWWEYLTDVPPLPTPEEYFNSTKYRRYGWMYDENFQVNDYSFSNLDLLSMSNISPGDPRLWIHLVSVWVISWWTCRLLWRYNEEAVALRMEYLNSAPPGGQSHTVLVTDIPGIAYGTLPDRIENTFLRFLPPFLKHSLVRGAMKAMEAGDRGLGHVMGLAAKPIFPDSDRSGGGTRGEAGGGSGEQPTSSHMAAGAFDSSTAAVPGRPPAPHQASSSREKADRELGEAAVQGKVVSEVPAWPRARRLLRSGLSTHDMVAREFEEVFPGQVEGIHVAYNTPRLASLAKEFQKTRQKLEDTLDLYLSQRQRGRVIRKRSMVLVVGLRYGDWGVMRYGSTPRRVDALEFYSAYLEELCCQIKQAQDEILPPHPEAALPAAFVTFSSRRAQVIAATTMLHHDRRYWHVDAAPEPRELIWQNLGYRRWERRLRQGLSWAAFFLIVAFYVPVVAAIQGLLQLDRLVNVPVIRDVVNLPLVHGIIEGLLPSLVLRIFLAVLPYLLEGLALWEGALSLSSVQFETMTKYFAFQVLTVFITSLVAGSFLNQVQQVINNPTSIVRTLGAAAPQTAIFFMTYLLLLGLTTKPIMFLRLPQLGLYWVMDLLARSDKAKQRVWRGQYMDYGYQTPDITIAVLLGLVFCVIAPLITPVAFLFFTATSELFKYQLLYVFSQQFESGGLMWSRVSDQIFFAVLMFQLVMIGLLGIKGVLVQTLLLLPLPFLTVLTWVSSNSLFRRPQQILSLTAASDLDARDKAIGVQADSRESRGEMYVESSFCISERDVRALINAARRVGSLLAATSSPSVQELQSQMEEDEVTDEEQPGASTRPATFAPHGHEGTSGLSSPGTGRGRGPTGSTSRRDDGEYDFGQGSGQDSALQQRLLGPGSRTSR